MNALRAGVLVVAAALVAGDWLMSRMMLHMFVQLPLLFAGGVLLALPRETPWARWNVPVLPAAVFVTGLVMTWMIPRALDGAIEYPAVNAAKVMSLLLAGAAGVRAWARASALVRTFVAGNSVWMMASVGMLYRDAPARLCTSYARSEQQQVGIALISLTVLATALGLWRLSTRRATGPTTGPLA